MKKRSRELSAFELTPLVDVVFLLLIFFMVSTVFKKDELSLLISLPKDANSAKTQKHSVTIELSDKELAFNGRPTTMSALENELRGILDKKTPLDLRIDQSVRYQRVAGLLGLLKKYNLSNLNLLTAQ